MNEFERVSQAFEEFSRVAAATLGPAFEAVIATAKQLGEVLHALDIPCPKCGGRWFDGRHQAWTWWRVTVIWCPEWMWAWVNLRREN